MIDRSRLVVDQFVYVHPTTAGFGVRRGASSPPDTRPDVMVILVVVFRRGRSNPRQYIFHERVDRRLGLMWQIRPVIVAGRLFCEFHPGLTDHPQDCLAVGIRRCLRQPHAIRGVELIFVRNDSELVSNWHHSPHHQGPAQFTTTLWAECGKTASFLVLGGTPDSGAATRRSKKPFNYNWLTKVLAESPASRHSPAKRFGVRRGTFATHTRSLTNERTTIYVHVMFHRGGGTEAAHVSLAHDIRQPPDGSE